MQRGTHVKHAHNTRALIATVSSRGSCAQVIFSSNASLTFVVVSGSRKRRTANFYTLNAVNAVIGDADHGA
jgi:hypothetical protein